MKRLVFLCFFLVFSQHEVESSPEDVQTYFYKQLGCIEKEGKVRYFKCPDFSLKNDSCRFKDQELKVGDSVDKEELKGSCNAACTCTEGGYVACAVYDCFQRLKSGCSHFKYTLDSCCPSDSICGPIEECKIDGKTFREGETLYRENVCEVCACDVGFKPQAPFCIPRKCYDQAYYQSEISNYGAPVFYRDDKCCPSSWISPEDEKIVKLNTEVLESDVYCKYGNRTVSLGYGFRKPIKLFSRAVPLKCECTIPPLVICKEEEVEDNKNSTIKTR
ncbi:hypothetical protein HHI36_017861 [Cryptolaemus montrouzieri]|uniref:VWFC domain-containing protein n=1 Tax=Cryptolaemus montrouzieri TaxID=559131 RepID=A0ABD2NNU3_9CUCU